MPIVKQSLAVLAAQKHFFTLLLCFLTQFLDINFSINLANAQSGAQSSAIGTSVWQKDSGFKKKSELDYDLKTSLLGYNYFSESTSDQKLQQQVEVDGQMKARWSGIDLAAKGIIGTKSLKDSHYFAVPELYASWAGQPGNYLFIGRKLQTFSQLDDSQNLGLFQPYFSNDFLNFKTQGLIGFGGQLANKSFGLTIGAYPIFIPNQAPQVSFLDGKVSSSNRWAYRPPPQFSFFDKNREIIYAIRDYSVNDITSSAGFALSSFWDPKGTYNDQRPLLKVSYAQLPLNDIPLSRETYGNIELVGQVLLTPVVAFHEVQSIDINLDHGKIIQTTFSYIQDQPSNKVAPVDETLQHLEPLHIFGFEIKSNLTQVFKRNLILKMSFAEIQGGEIKDLDSSGEEGIFTFSNRRTLFRRPFGLSLSTDIILGKKPLITEIKWVYDMADRGALLSGQVTYPVWKQAFVNLGFDMLGVENDDSSSQNFIQRNKANDRVYGGLSYVF